MYRKICINLVVVSEQVYLLCRFQEEKYGKHNIRLSKIGLLCKWIWYERLKNYTSNRKNVIFLHEPYIYSDLIRNSFHFLQCIIWWFLQSFFNASIPENCVVFQRILEWTYVLDIEPSFSSKQTFVSYIHVTQALHLPKLFIAQLMTSFEYFSGDSKPLNTRTQSFISSQDKVFGTQILLCKNFCQIFYCCIQNFLS